MRASLPTADEIAALPADGGAEFNRLIHEPSPYLLQHARNPVDWYPWGDEAFARARELDRPVFLSIGYATCHWCHVMERESFEDAEVAALMNEAFVCVKVDREERPDIDHVYMTVAQLMTGSGGWPLTVVLTPDRQPFFAGTYFPKHGVWGRPGMVELVPALARAWRDDREGVLATAGRATGALEGLAVGSPGDLPGARDRAAAVRRLAAGYDARHGGFGRAPKFPSPHQLSLLLRHAERTGDEDALAMATHTLRRMRMGGLFDHVGYGFHRYSTDAEWLVPHFEKMLYDQAMLSIAYLEAYQLTGDPTFADVAHEVFGYVLRDLTAPQGGFYSAEDADSEGEEGRFYLWTAAELRDVLGDEDAALIGAVFGVVDEGNYRDEVQGGTTGANILHLARPLADVAADHGLEVDELAERVEGARAALFERRQRRVRPLLDDKVLTDWNGLMIAALARGGVVLDDRRYVDAARRAAEFALTELRDDDGRLRKRWRNGIAGLPAHLDDHAFLGWGLLELYEATHEPRYLEEALAITEQLRERFADADSGGFFLTADDGESLLVRSQEYHDGAIPSGNSIAAMCLLRLARITGDPALDRAAERALRANGAGIDRAPEGHAQTLIAADFAEGPSFEVVIAGSAGAADTDAMFDALRGRFLPRAVVLFRDADAEPPPVARVAPFTVDQRAIDGRATAYVCRERACAAPTTDPAEMLALLAAAGPAAAAR